MHRPITLALSTLLACGPLTPATDVTSTTAETTTTTTSSSGTTTTLPASTTSTTPTSTTTTIPTTTDPTSSGTTLADDFIVMPDEGIGPVQCDVFAQDCPPGKKCAAWAEGGGGTWNATKCVDIIGDGAPGEPCTTVGGGISGSDDCALGVTCWNVDETNHGTCVALCTGTPEAPQCPPGSECLLSGDAVLNLCLLTCDPLLQDCVGDDLCIPSLEGNFFRCVQDASGDLGQANDPCEFGNACDKGLMCLEVAAASSACDPGSTGCCTPFCTFPGSPCPNPDQQCNQWVDAMNNIPPGYESVGICAIPT